MTSAIPPLESLRSLAAVDPAGAAGPAAASMQSMQAPNGLGERFSQALAEARFVPEQGAHVQGPSAVSQAVSAQDAAFDTLTTKIDTFEASSASLSVQQVAAQSLQIQREITSQMVKIYVGTAVAQGGKSTVQTLMKNQ
jgi:type III secretion inner rod protein HrpB2